MASLRAFASSAASLGITTVSPSQTRLRRAGIVIAASAFVAACAHVAVPLPFSPVPFTLQPFAVLLLALLLSPADSFLAMAAYLLEGAAGLPVFSPAGLGGVAQLLGPTGGYLFAYPVAAPLAGWLLRSLRMPSRFVAGVLSGAAALAVVFAMGAGWLAAEMHISAGHAFALGVLPFAPSEAVKLCGASSIAAALRRNRNAA